QCSPRRALHAGLRPGPFPDRAASLLPGLLAVTRTGLTPAGDNELMFGSGHTLAPPPNRWAHVALPPERDSGMVARSPTSLALSQPASPSLEVDLGQPAAGAARARPPYAFASSRGFCITAHC